MTQTSHANVAKMQMMRKVNVAKMLIPTKWGRTIFRGKLRWGEDIFDATLGGGVVKRFLAECKCRENANDAKW